MNISKIIPAIVLMAVFSACAAEPVDSVAKTVTQAEQADTSAESESLIEQSQPATAKQYIGNVMSAGAKEHYTIVVETVPKKLYLLKVSGDNQTLIDSATILTGREGGSKLVENDGKTPEGVYYIVDHMTDAEMLRRWGYAVSYKYGIAAYPTNYPNPIDKIMKRTGYGIWLHGLDPERAKPATEGCVGMQNEDMERMQPSLSLDMPIVIINNALFQDEAEYKEQRDSHLNALNTFIKAWNSSDYETFKANIHPKYASYAAYSQSAYLAKKKALMNSYPNRYIAVDNVNVYRQNDLTLVYDFDQFYCADNLVSYGNKKFYLMNENGTEKLISEEMSASPVRPYLDPIIKQFVEDWRQAWESRDIDKYMKFYSSNFANKWRDSKELVFSENQKLTVDISDLKWELAGGNRIRISFRQNYASDNSSDSGIKTLLIAGCPGSYEILSETWRAR